MSDDPKLEPMLGLATTRELLVELKSRMETSREQIFRNVFSDHTEELHEAVRKALNSLPNAILSYRTVDQ